MLNRVSLAFYRPKQKSFRELVLQSTITTAFCDVSQFQILMFISDILIWLPLNDTYINPEVERWEIQMDAFYHFSSFYFPQFLTLKIFRYAEKMKDQNNKLPCIYHVDLTTNISHTCACFVNTHIHTHSHTHTSLAGVFESNYRLHETFFPHFSIYTIISLEKILENFII